MLKIRQRKQLTTAANLPKAFPAFLKTIYQNRGVQQTAELEYALSNLASFHQLKDIDRAASRLAKAILNQESILVVGDFDCDGATSSALAVLALNAMNAAVQYLVPDRFKLGYGLSKALVEIACQQNKPDIIITVDNGIASIEGVEAANSIGVDVIITDHHLPAETLPDAYAIVNPNQLNCPFPWKNTAGVGVIFYVLCALRAELKKQLPQEQSHRLPHMAQFLDLVALGTVADVVPLDYNNRILVSQGLERIQSGQARVGINALIQVANLKSDEIFASNLAFALGPRLNAAGRLDTMSLGIELLMSDDPIKANLLALQLDDLNKTRKHIENKMRHEAMVDLEQCVTEDTFTNNDTPWGICLYRDNWHQGVVGILASKIKEKTGKPVIVFAPDADDLIKGSGRSISGFHIRDALSEIAASNPDLIVKFGGHAMAAGLTLRQKDFEVFSFNFDLKVKERITEEDLNQSILTDGSLKASEFSLQTAQLLRKSGPWGQGFPEPVFEGHFTIVEQKLLKDAHLKMKLALPNSRTIIDAIAFSVNTELWPNLETRSIRCAYRLDINTFWEQPRLQMIIEALEAVSVLNAYESEPS